MDAADQLAYDAANPAVYDEFCNIARSWLLKRDRISARFIVHWIRWRTLLGTWRVDEYSLNDHMSTRYAKKFMADFPQYGTCFQLRDNRAAREAARQGRGDAGLVAVHGSPQGDLFNGNA